MRGTLNLENIDTENPYEKELNEYNGAEVKVLGDYGDTYEIETPDGSEYTIFKNELIQG